MCLANFSLASFFIIEVTDAVDEEFTLSDAEVGKTLRINSVSDSDPKKLRFMSKLGLLPGVSVTLESKTPFEGNLDIKVDESHYHLPLAVARKIYVTRIEKRLKSSDKKHQE